MEQAESNLDSLRVFTTEKWFVQLGMAARGIACCSKCGTSGRIVMQVPAFKLPACSRVTSNPECMVRRISTEKRACVYEYRVSSPQEEGGEPGVWLRVRILNSLVFSFSTTVRAIRDSLREATHVCSASFRIIDSISVR